jgi:hypothetical protein
MDGSKEQQPDKATILEQLKRILADKIFAKAPNPRMLLQHVVEQAVEGRQTELTEAIIAEKVFGKKLDYSKGADKVPDNVVRTTANRLRPKLLEYYSRPIRQMVVISLQPGSYVPEFRLPTDQETRQVKPDSAPATISLRRQEQTVTVKQARVMIVHYDLYCSNWNDTGKGIEHRYERKILDEEIVILDHATGLMWQRTGSSDETGTLTWLDAKTYIAGLNAKRYATFDDWRLPTLEELMSLMTPAQIGMPVEIVSGSQTVNRLVHLDPIFQKRPYVCWSSDSASPGCAWMVYFLGGYCGERWRDAFEDVKAVRTM